MILILYILLYVCAIKYINLLFRCCTQKAYRNSCLLFYRVLRLLQNRNYIAQLLIVASKNRKMIKITIKTIQNQKIIKKIEDTKDKTCHYKEEYLQEMI